jgi:hypothetical protein
VPFRSNWPARLCIAFVGIARLATAQYVGSLACKSCHEAEFSRQSSSEHALALLPDLKTEWAFGAGTQVISFVSQVDGGSYREDGMSYYPSKKAKALTPGHMKPDGTVYRIFDPDSAILRCFQCHSTGPLRLAANNKIVVKETGVRCEACHGPGGEHAKKGDKYAIFTPRRLNAAAINQFCGACHRKTAGSNEETDWRDPWNVRYAPLGLSESACFRQSKGALTCMTCHDPHDSLQRTGYDAKCSNCHPKPVHKVPTAKRSCVSCHMPSVSPQANLAFANHWIGIYREAKASLTPMVH